MKRFATFAILAALAPAALCSHPATAQPPTPSPATRDDGLRITRAGSQPSARGPAEYFTGSVRVDPLFPATAPSRMSGGLVTFEPGARSNWHTHPVGQVLIVTAGLGWVQRESGPIEEIRPGDVVWIASGVRHWHGATATTGMSHIALQEQEGGRAVEWMDGVTDTQYGGAARTSAPAAVGAR